MGDIVEAVLQKLFPWMLDPMGKALQGMMVGAFSSTAGSVSYAEWNVAITAANRIGWVMGFVNMLICAVGAVHAAVKASPAESVKSFAMAVLAWPLTAICVSVMITCEGIVSLLSARILAVGADTTKGRGMESMVSAMFKKILEQASVLHSLTMLLVYLVLFVGVFLLCCMLAARTLCLVLLAAVAPLPVMSAGWKATRPAMRRWLSAVVGVMLAKPLAALVITVGSALMTSQTTSGVGEGSFWAQVVEGSGVEVVGTPFHGACYLFDPERRRATAVLALKVEEWTLSTDASKSSRAAALNDLTARLADTPGVVELKETALLLPGAAPAPDLPDDGGSPEWMRRDMAELWALPEVMTPLANVSYVSVTCDVDRLKGVDRARGRLTERERVGVALGDLVKMTVAPALVECGARPGSVRWCGLDDLRTLIRSVSDPAGNADRPPVTRDEPTLGWCEESLDGESVTLESCVARTWWVTQWPDRPVPAGWTRDILQGGRMIALTHIWRPMSMEKSEKDLRDRESSILQRDTLQNQRKLSRDERRERREQRQREAEQDANWPDTDHQGFITLFAPDRDMLAVFERDLRVRVGKYHLRLSGLRGQQRQALTAVLPLGL